MQERIDTKPTVDEKGEVVKGDEVIKKSIENIRREYDMFVQKKKDLTEFIANFKEQCKREGKLRDLIVRNDNFKKVEPTYKFELEDEYWELARQKQLDKNKSEEAAEKAKTEQLEAQLEHMQKEIDSAKEKLEEFGEKVE